MTKEEIIKEAWGEYYGVTHWKPIDKPKPPID